MPKRIAIITTSYPERPGDACGHFVAAEAEEHALAGHEVHVICPGGARTSTHGIRVHGCGGGAAFGWPGAAARLRRAPWRAKDAARFVLEARRTLSRLDGVDRVEAHWMLPAAWPIASGSRVPLNVTCHGGDVRLLRALPRPLREHIVSDVLSRVERLSFAGRRLKRDLADSLGPRLAEAVMSRGLVRSPMVQVIIPSRTRRQAARHGLAADTTPCAVVVGRLVAGKRVDLAIRSVAAAARPWRLVVLGDGPDRAELERLAGELDVDVTMTGQLDREAAHATIAACDLLLHTSVAEGAPSVIREARVLGLPVVATASGDVAEWATRDPAITISDAEPRALAACLDRHAEPDHEA